MYNKEKCISFDKNNLEKLFWCLFPCILTRGIDWNRFQNEASTFQRLKLNFSIIFRQKSSFFAENRHFLPKDLLLSVIKVVTKLLGIPFSNEQM